MGIVVELHRISPQKLEVYKKDSKGLEKEIQNPGIKDPSSFIYLDKSWDGIIYLLTGENFEKTENEIAKVILGNRILERVWEFYSVND